MKNRTPASLRAANSDSLNGTSSNAQSGETFSMSDLFSGLASFTKQVSSTLNSYEIRKLADKAQGYVLNFTEVELKVREATNEDPWGPTGPQIQEIAQLTHQYDAFPEVMGMIWKRMLQDNKLAWRRVYKSLMLLQGLLKLGNERTIANARDHLFEMRSLEHYKCVDERGRDQGVNIRHRVKQIIELLQDDEMLMEERRKARGENKDKYQGYSKEDMMMRGGMSSSRSDNFDSWDKKSSSGFSRKDKFDDLPEPKSSREVNAFDFDDGRQRNSSPELGIPDHSQMQQHQEDDEFGDFADARGNSNANNAQSSAYNTLGLTRASAPNTDFFGAPVQAPAPSAHNRPKPPSGSSSPVQKEGNLFDLDFGAPAGNGTSANNSNGTNGNSGGLDGLLGGQSGTFGAPAGSGGFGVSSAPVGQSVSNNAGFDIFGSAPVQQQNVGQASAPAQQSQGVDLFGDFSSPVQSPVHQPQGKTIGFGQSNDFDDIFGNMSSAPAVPVAQPQPVAQKTSTAGNGVNTNGNTNTNDAWSFMEKQLDGLTLGAAAQKKAPTMNEMMRR